LGPDSFHQVVPAGQEACPAPGTRRCLLKDCEEWFTPACPRSRFCSGECAAAARRWRCVKASRRYRASDAGRVRRREQNRHYRQRRRERAAFSASAGAAAPREGQRPALGAEVFGEHMCDRPGCYVAFAVPAASTSRHFCSTACRLALRRVLDREWRYRQRRRRWRREGRRRCRASPDTS
jgi:hypothetical protein